MAEILKSDLINGAFGQLRISGITVESNAEDNEIALGLLEATMAEWESRGYCIGYKFPFGDNSADPGDPSGISLEHRYASECALAVRLADYFGKTVPDRLQRNHSTSFSGLAASVAVQLQTQYPNTMPRGSTTELRNNRWQRYFRKTQNAPLSCSTEFLLVGEIDSYFESFSAYLNDGEEISSFTISANDGLTILSSGLNSAKNQVVYTVEATEDAARYGPWLQLFINATTSDSRVETRAVNFQVESSGEES